MALKNISKLFYKDYYQGIDFNYVLNNSENSDKCNVDYIKKVNKDIEGSQLQVIPSISCCNHRFSAKILYPGLVTGTGLTHDFKKIEGAYNLGMHFDYTFGMPIVYGSSVKGVLCQYFKEFCQDYKANAGKAVISDDIEDLYQAIFKGKKRDPENPVDKNKKPNYINLSIYERDIFFDAVVVKSYTDRKRNMHLLEDDSITPHTEGPLKNPIPIAMLKIAPGCILEFRFLLRKSVINGRTYDENWKIGIFKEILKTVGIGAKTNVGYGQMELISHSS